MRKPVLLIVALVLLVAGLWGMRVAQAPRPQFAPQLEAPLVTRPEPPRTGTANALPAFLPAEAADTLARIQRGGPFAHPQDGAVFGNREQRLPERPRGYYHEYTVETPGLRNRGARRIVTGGTPPEIWYYSEDHYETFKSFAVPAQEAAR